jgi:hypothetical protein
MPMPALRPSSRLTYKVAAAKRWAAGRSGKCSGIVQL